MALTSTERTRNRRARLAARAAEVEPVVLQQPPAEGPSLSLVGAPEPLVVINRSEAEALPAPVLEIPGLLIDWMTLRIALSNTLMSDELLDRWFLSMRDITCYAPTADSKRRGDKLELVTVWSKSVVDVDALRSDSLGVYWSMQDDGKQRYLVIGGSPASLAHGCNVFGSSDVRVCAEILWESACKEIGLALPDLFHYYHCEYPEPHHILSSAWQLCRLDITTNHALPDMVSVKQCLRQLMTADGARRKATNRKGSGDTVEWSPTSDLVKGKAYHKGPQMRHLVNLGKLVVSETFLAAADCLLRLEHTRGSRFFRRLREKAAKTGGKHSWWDMTSEVLAGLHMDFFGKITGGLEVADMGKQETLELIASASGISMGRARAAHNTLTNIQTFGWDNQKSTMPSRTWCLHLKYLRAAGFSDAQLNWSGPNNVLPFRTTKIILAVPVASWAQMGVAA